jgi:hypothetical protein
VCGERERDEGVPPYHHTKLEKEKKIITDEKKRDPHTKAAFYTDPRQVPTPATTMEGIFPAVVRLNNQAIELLQSHNVNRAADCFQGAFDKFQQIVADLSSSTTNSEEEETTTRNNSTTTTACSIQVEYIDDDLFQSSQDIAVLQDDLFSMYPVVFRFQPSDNHPNTVSLSIDEAHQVILALLYNIATTDYCKSMQPNHRNNPTTTTTSATAVSSYLHRAGQFYQLAITLAQREPQRVVSSSTTTTTSSSGNTILVLALQRNWAHWLYRNTPHYQERLLKFVPYMMTTLQHYAPRISPEQYTYFYSPLFHLKERGLPCTAPSA